jgi:hypothetical protein
VGDPVVFQNLIAGERHLRAVVHEFAEHYHAERNHQRLGNVIPFPFRDSASVACSHSTSERLRESGARELGRYTSSIAACARTRVAKTWPSVRV